MINRREILAGGAMMAAIPGVARAALPIVSKLPVPDGNKLGFDVLRKGSKLGTHLLAFERNGDDVLVRIVVDLAYKVGPFTLYRYTHRATERWSGGLVTALQTTTNDDGKKYAVIGYRDKGGLAVEGTLAPRYVAPANALPATHWNRRELDGPWINTQDGRLMRPKITTIGIDAVPDAAGDAIRASHVALTGDVVLDMWYDDKPSWAALRFTAKDGSQIQYQRI